MAVASQDKADTPKAEAAKAVEPIIIDLGKHKKGRIRRLHKGRGPLFAKVLDVHHELKSQGHLDDASRPVVVLVKAKKKGGRRRRWRNRIW